MHSNNPLKTQLLNLLLPIHMKLNKLKRHKESRAGKWGRKRKRNKKQSSDCNNMSTMYECI